MQPAIICENYEISYSEFNKLISDFTHIMKINMGGRRQLVAIRCGISVEAVIIYAACLSAKIPVVMWNEDNSDDRKTSLETAYKPVLIWQKRHTIAGYSEVYSWHEYVLYRAEQFHCYDINPALALLLSTSGSTGSSRHVKISYKNLDANTSAIVDALHIKAGDKAMVMLPLSYTYGLSVVNTYLKMHGTLLVPSHKAAQKEFWDFADKYSCNAISGVPITYDLLRTLKLDWGKHPSIKLVTQAGGRLSNKTEQYMLDLSMRFGFDFAVMYGQTEATARMSCHFLNKHPDKIGSVGVAIRGGAFSECDGELIYHGDNVAMGYAESYRDLIHPDEWQGVLKTGDMGYMDEDGYIYITGRKKRIVKINGARINLDELEQYISDSTGIAACCIEACDRPVVFIETNINEDSNDNNDERLHDTISTIKHSIRQALYRIGISRHDVLFYTLKHLPTNANGKPNYVEMTKLATKFCETQASDPETCSSI